MNQAQTFRKPEFGTLRTVLVNDEPHFVGKDVAKILGYSNPRKAIADHVDAEDKTDGVTIRDSIGRDQKPVVINESGLYSLILSSKMPNAKRFKRWVTSEILPAIRKTGGYMAARPDETPEETLARALLIAQETMNRQRQQIETMAPKALFADAVSTSETTILIGELAKILKGNGIDIGQNRLFEWLRNNGYLIKRKGTDYNLPTQRAMELGLFKIKETAITHSDGHTSVSKTTKVTGKGQQYFIDAFLGRPA